MKTQFDNNQPIYRQLVEWLKGCIASGEMALGQKVPTVRELAAACKVNPNTMQRALAKMEDMGYMYNERTGGRFVTTDENIVAQLRNALPASLTAQYVRAMEEAGIPAASIPSYVEKFLQEAQTKNEGSE
ncbi:MAG: GntR family transcriptional regulator [Defluviitaleaceae bacterium]|nr:GntR family transcriptional regulator [Defluviitaleaceae bacterium]MCL2273729.1 GntR family transcriptional regulator [Defluviitaleaceae bacterium]